MGAELLPRPLPRSHPSPLGPVHAGPPSPSGLCTCKAGPLPAASGARVTAAGGDRQGGPLAQPQAGGGAGSHSGQSADISPARWGRQPGPQTADPRRATCPVTGERSLPPGPRPRPLVGTSVQRTPTVRSSSPRPTAMAWAPSTRGRVPRQPPDGRWSDGRFRGADVGWHQRPLRLGDFGVLALGLLDLPPETPPVRTSAPAGRVVLSIVGPPCHGVGFSGLGEGGGRGRKGRILELI